MANPISLIIFPVSDVEKAKTVYTTFLGTEPYADTPYYVGYKAGEQEIGLVPNSHDKLCYSDVEDITASIKELEAAGAQIYTEPKNVGGGLMVAALKDADGNIVEVHCTYDPASKGGNSPDGRKVKSTMHWVSAAHAISAEIRLYDKLFTKPDPSDVEEGQDILSNLNPNSLEILTTAKLEPSLANATLEDHYQFERVGYFCLDPDSTPGNLVFNRTLSLKDSWAKIEKKAGG